MSSDLKTQMSEQLSAAIEAVGPMHGTVEAGALAALLKDAEKSKSIAVIDVRDEEEFAAQSAAGNAIKGSINIPHYSLLEGVEKLKAVVSEKQLTALYFVSLASPDIDAAAADLWSDGIAGDAAMEKVTVNVLLGGIGNWVEQYGTDADLVSPKI